jgi:hypothetical protein
MKKKTQTPSKQRLKRTNWFYPATICFVLSIASLAAFDFSSKNQDTKQTNKTNLDAETSVLAYVGGKDSWQVKQVKELAKGQEFQFDNRFCYIDQNGLTRMNPGVDINLLNEADRIYQKDNARFPESKDIVRFVSKNHKHSHFERMGTLKLDNQFFYQGRLFQAVLRGTPPSLSVEPTGIVLSRVTQTFKKQAKALIDLTVTNNSGKEFIISGTPEHPFFVPSLNKYIELQYLKEGIALKTDNGSFAKVKSLSKREGDFTVYNFEVEGTHNYFVASNDGGPAVNVHNTCKLSKIDGFVDLTDRRKIHILNRHRHGANLPNKSEFPKTWSDDRILHQISDIVTDPKSIHGVEKIGKSQWEQPFAIGTRDGIKIRVDLFPSNSKHAGKISTGYPLNTPRNPAK